MGSTSRFSFGTNKNYNQAIKLVSWIMNATRLKVTKLDEVQMKVVMCYEPGAIDVITQVEELDTEDAAKAWQNTLRSVGA